MADRLGTYKAKRDFEKTPEPKGEGAASRARRRFVVQEHHARRLHWDLRLEHEGTLASWALPRGVPEHPDENRLAVHTEDHPLEYLEFEGEIPKGEYGAGTMKVWDRGTYEAEKFRDDEVIATFHGERMRGRYALFRTRENDWMIHRMDPPEDPAYEPMPERIKPMLARSGKLPPREEQFGFEVKWDGIRTVAILDHGHIDLQGRTSDFTPATRRCASWRARSARGRLVLDGEVVALDERGPPELRAAPVAHAPGLGLGRAAADARHPGHLRDLRPALPRRPLDPGALLRGAPRRCSSELELEGPAWRTPGATTAARAAALLAATRSSASRASWPSASTAPTSPARAPRHWIKVKNVPHAGRGDRRLDAGRGRAQREPHLTTPARTRLAAASASGATGSRYARLATPAASTALTPTSTSASAHSVLRVGGLRHDPPGLGRRGASLVAHYGLDYECRSMALNDPALSIAVRASGAGDPVVFIHGSGMSGATWAPLIACLPDYRSIAIDLPGFGLSDGYSYSGRPLRAHAVAQLTSVLDALSSNAQRSPELRWAGCGRCASRLTHPSALVPWSASACLRWRCRGFAAIPSSRC